MGSDVVLATSGAFVWMLLAASGFFQIRVRSSGPHKLIVRVANRSWCAWFGVLLVALLVRLVPMLWLPVGAAYDIESFRLVAEALLAGEDVYTSAAVGRHPYLPFQMYLIGLALYGARLTALPFVVLVKVPAVLADVAITALVYRTSRRWGTTKPVATRWALLYALNPISILVSAYHGQFDAIPILLLLLAWYYWHFGRRTLFSAVALGLAVLSKTWPIVLLSVVLLRLHEHRRRLTYAAVTLVIPTLFTLAYVLALQTDPIPMLQRALTHTGPSGYWGVSALLAVAGKYHHAFQTLFEELVSVRRWLLLAAGLFALWRTRRQSTLSALTTIILTVFAVSVGMGLQWLLWVVPFALLAGDVGGLKWYSLTGTLFLLVQLYGFHMVSWAGRLFGPETNDLLIRLVSILPWITIVLWAGHRLRAENVPITKRVSS